ncbi:MAG TPA: sigma-70 family RNA polymerase sigma factor, partial [Acidimicrobiales bacterium]|nr:sigma-70 family RNA polymerase sigma factor [Acidimicrobiales bacterium]
MPRPIGSRPTRTPQALYFLVIETPEPGQDVGPSDDELAKAASAGDRAALEELLRRHYDRIHRICRRVTGHDEDALDATQEALIAVTRGISRFDGRSSFSTWVYRVATNASLDELRRRRRRPMPAGSWQSDGDADGSPAGVDEESRRDEGAPDVATTVADRLDLDAAVKALPPDQRAAVVL